MIANQVLATDQFKWFYWAGFLFAAGFVLMMVALAIGYYVRVLRPKYRGKEVK